MHEDFISFLFDPYLPGILGEVICFILMSYCIGIILIMLYLDYRTTGDISKYESFILIWPMVIGYGVGRTVLLKTDRNSVICT